MARWKYRLIAGLQLIGLLIFTKVFLELLLNPTWGPVVLWGIILLGCARFVWTITFRWYPVVKARFGLPRVIKVFLGLNALLWLPGFCFARYALNSITGVDAGHFPTALWAFTLGGIACVWLVLILLWLGLTSFKSFVMVGSLMTWDEVRTFFWDLTQPGRPKRPLPIGRHLMDLAATFSVIMLIGMGSEHSSATRRTLDALANLVLVGTEFSHDRTCAASSATRWVAPLKDRKEFKSSNVLVATYHAWNNISFKIDQCDDATKAHAIPVTRVSLADARDRHF
jgi:hypothetical protein